MGPESGLIQGETASDGTASPSSSFEPPPTLFSPTGRVSQHTLILIRWIAVAGQLAAVVIVHWGLGYSFEVEAALVIIGVSALLNLAATAQGRARMRLSERDAALYLGYDLVQIGALLFLTGGIENPFTLLLIAPVTVSATLLDRNTTAVLTLLALSIIALINWTHYPLPSVNGEELPQDIARIGIWVALTSATIFIAVFIFQVAQDAKRLADALVASELARARENRLSAVGALAAAAAHELGTPLNTILLAAKDLAHELPQDSDTAEDARLIVQQAEACRGILVGLARRPPIEEAETFGAMPIAAVVEDAAARHLRNGVDLRIEIAEDLNTVLMRRTPEAKHAIGNLIQNAVQFASGEVKVSAEPAEDGEIVMTVMDDGPGFPPSVLARLGEPYISNRQNARAGDHMGLGIFIAIALLEHAGAKVRFSNDPDKGAKVEIRWPSAIFSPKGGTS